MELELIQQHLAAGDVVEILECHGSLGTCEGNKEGLAWQCDACVLARGDAFGCLQRAERLTRSSLDAQLSVGDQADAEEWAAGPMTLDDFKHLQFDGADLGWGVVSSVVSATRDPFCSSEAAWKALRSFAKAAYLCYLATSRFLKKRDPYDRVYIFNGRFAVTRAAFRAAQNAGCSDVVLYERGSSLSRYATFNNHLPHSISGFRKRLQHHIQKLALERTYISVGEDFFEKRRAGVMQAWWSFTAHQTPGLLPDTWDRKRKNVVIFTSSEDEFVAIGDEWSRRPYSTQSAAIQRIAEDALNKLPTHHFTVRVHPNLRGIKNRETEAISALRSPNLTLIPPDSAISSYALIDEADTVLTFGSTVGVEATYWGKPSIVAGPCFYMHSGAAYDADDHEMVMTYLASDLVPRPKDAALQYGAYVASFGEPFRYFRATALHDGMINGCRLGDIVLRSFMQCRMSSRVATLSKGKLRVPTAIGRLVARIAVFPRRLRNPLKAIGLLRPAAVVYRRLMQ